MNNRNMSFPFHPKQICQNYLYLYKRIVKIEELIVIIKKINVNDIE